MTFVLKMYMYEKPKLRNSKSCNRYFNKLKNMIPYIRFQSSCIREPQ